ncbi:Putative outer membrane protein [Elusimicrobium minutum Pei191]|uniref:Putative outer membrane protein n=1 Tax=Elusimicrobium minutum (strain Pei191) TaxID=445932 RepID=B2KB88_ELUMP|nr:outer membrane protein [Elusimicrobium minutum]ACC97910.1 Putative outer membrane protein [Elusimicrobium minutum Pei191]
MDKLKFFFLIILTANTFSYSQDKSDFDKYSKYNGKTISSVNVSTVRVEPPIVKEKFLLKEGDIFAYEAFDYARKALHDMRIFKSMEIEVEDKTDNTVDINISCKDGHYVFPIIFAGFGQGGTTLVASLMEANLFRQGELAMLLAGISGNGYMAGASLSANDQNIAIFFSKLDYEQREYENGSFSPSSLFSTTRIKKAGTVRQFDVKETNATFVYGRSFLEIFSLSAGYNYSRISYSGVNAPQDSGNHSTVFASAKYFKHMKPSKGAAAAFGSLFGLGVSDRDEKIVKLPKPRLGYYFETTYNNGGSHTGADFNISQLSASARTALELPARHVIGIEVNAQETFEGPFALQTKSTDLLGRGRYSREFRGEKGLGAGAYITVLAAKNKTGILAIEPFAETSFIWDDKHSSSRQNGFGASAYYKFWRFPLPLGLTYTRDTTNNENNFSLMLGSGF